MSLNSPKVLTIKEAAPLLKVGEQAVREMIKAGCIKGACCWGSDKHRTYYITDEQILNMQRGKEEHE